MIKCKQQFVMTADFRTGSVNRHPRRWQKCTKLDILRKTGLLRYACGALQERKVHDIEVYAKNRAI